MNRVYGGISSGSDTKHCIWAFFYNRMKWFKSFATVWELPKDVLFPFSNENAILIPWDPMIVIGYTNCHLISKHRFTCSILWSWVLKSNWFKKGLILYLYILFNWKKCTIFQSFCRNLFWSHQKLPFFLTYFQPFSILPFWDQIQELCRNFGEST